MNEKPKIIDRHLAGIRRSFDISSDYHIKKMNEYEEVPHDVLSDDELELLYNIRIDSGLREFRNFINPKRGTKLLDIGCYLNLIFYKYHKWQSLYFGIDISENVIDILNKYVKKHKIVIGDLQVASSDKIPYSDNYFDYVCCINVFEYFTKSYSKKSLAEISRVIKPGGKFVVDIPNPDHKCFEIMLKVEKYFKRENKFIFGRKVFEDLLHNDFEIAALDTENLMIKYFLIKK